MEKNMSSGVLLLVYFVLQHLTFLTLLFDLRSKCVCVWGGILEKVEKPEVGEGRSTF